MERVTLIHLNRNVLAFYLLLVTHLALISVTSSTTLVPNPLLQQDVGCEGVACGHGNCKASNDSLLGFDCECHLGWTKFQIGRLVFPSCVIPNCTFDFQCFNGSQRSPSPLFLQPLNFSNPCALIWCGHDGKCEPNNGNKYSCQCSEGSTNFVNNTALPCFKQCYLGADCNNVINGIIGPPVLSPPSSQVPPHNGSTKNGSAEILRILHAVTFTLILAVTLLST